MPDTPAQGPEGASPVEVSRPLTSPNPEVKPEVQSPQSPESAQPTPEAPTPVETVEQQMAAAREKIDAQLKQELRPQVAPQKPAKLPEEVIPSQEKAERTSPTKNKMGNVLTFTQRDRRVGYAARHPEGQVKRAA